VDGVALSFPGTEYPEAITLSAYCTGHGHIQTNESSDRRAGIRTLCKAHAGCLMTHRLLGITYETKAKMPNIHPPHRGGDGKTLSPRGRRVAPEASSAMVGTPPSARKSPAVPADPKHHAEQFAAEYADRLEHYVEGRMHSLDIPEQQMGASDPDHGVPWCVFFPHEHLGGSVASGGRIYVDSGVLNPDLLATHPQPDAPVAWSKARLRDRIDAIIAHELTESETGSHVAAEERAPDTPLAISEGARHILRAMAGTDKPLER
jgi:hypothetical protein